MGKVTWLHLSDLHICPPRSGWHSDAVMKGILKDLEHLQLSQQLRPDLVFFTGDAAFGNIGKQKGETLRDQFTQFASFLNDVREVFSPTIPKDNVFLVPGNHDVNREAIHPELSQFLNTTNLQEVEALLQRGGTRLAWYMSRLTEYRKFLEDNDFSYLLDDPERLIYSTVREVGSTRVGIAGLNTAWSSGRKGGGDKGALWFGGQWQIARMTHGMETIDFSVVLLHHPPNWLTSFEDPLIWRELKRHFNFILHGHQHQSWVEINKGESAIIAAGASYGQHERGYNLVTFDSDTGTGEVWLRRWDGAGGGWTAHPRFEKTDSRGIWPFELELPSGEAMKETPGAQTPEENYQTVKGITSTLKGIAADAEQDFLQFSEILVKIDRETNSFIRRVMSEIPKMDVDRCEILIVLSSKLNGLPTRLEKELGLTENILKNESQNYLMIQIILVEYAERFTAPLADLIQTLCERVYAVSGEPSRQPECMSTFSESVSALAEKAGIERYQSLLNLIRNERKTLINYLEAENEQTVPGIGISRARLLEALWGSFDLIVTEEFFARRESKDLLGAILGNDTDESVKKMVFVLAILSSEYGDESVVDGIEGRFERGNFSERDKKVVLRSLVLHRTNRVIRKYATVRIDLTSIWRLASFSRFPMVSINEVAERLILEESRSANDQKILFDLVHDVVAAKILRPSEPSMLAEVQMFMQIFADSTIMMSPDYHERYVALLRALVEMHGSFLRDRTYQLYADIQDYSQHTYAESPDVSSLLEVPEIAMAKLFSRPLYFYYVITHEDAEVANLAIPHLRDVGKILQCLRNDNINSHLLSKISRIAGMLRDGTLRRAWAFNRRASASDAEWILRSLQTRDLQQLMRKVDSPGPMKQLAVRILKERNRKRR